MATDEKHSSWLKAVSFLFQNGLTKTGTILTTSSAISLLFFWSAELTSGRSVHPYMGLLLYLVLPSIFVFGLLLVPLGAWLSRRKRRKQGVPIVPLQEVDLASPLFRRAAGLVGGLTFLNVLIVGIATYRGIEYMDSNQFCGKTCHSVMEPEDTTYQDSPHVRVGCVGCHIGPGAGWFVKSKLSGVRQIYAVNFKTYSRPIPVPVKALRPARETCEQCHWPEKFHGDKVVVRTHYADDAANTKQQTVLVLHLGGHSKGAYEGIHGRHLDTNAPISYVSIDEKRQVIPSVFLGSRTNERTEFLSSEIKATQEQLTHGEHRVMDCIDCHNRPSHRMALPERAMDQALLEGRVSTKIPFIRKQGVAILKAASGNRDEALAQIASQLDAYYKQNHAEFYGSQKALLDAAVQQIQALWSRNVYPQMKITWGTYPENIGHEESPGCYRCHDGNHKAQNGKMIASECDTCHAILAQDESDPKILKDLGIKE